MEKVEEEINNWQSSNIQVFWGEIAPYDHLVQIYENNNSFFNTLEGFAGDGLIKGESVVLVATAEHLNFLSGRLRVHGFDLDTFMATDQYIPVDANESIANFMVNNQVDEARFNTFIDKIMKRAKKNNQKVRAFGEMKTILLAGGQTEAAVKVEKLWHNIQQQYQICLFCAYPKSIFSKFRSHASIKAICKVHSKIIDGRNRPSTEIYYKEI
ncbi:MAG TPA: MEDS domain-containing protein [Bacteroidia bacterium]|nr:MEDS domain-containing protein [Bacteroidia bacterium]